MTDNTSTERETIDVLAESFVARFRAGQRPSIEEFAGRYPELADQLRELLPALVLLEQNASPDETAGFGRKATDTVTPREVGDFTIVREIGRGGMGVVYEAVQQSLGRHVALKVLSTPALLNPTHLERFRLEARAAARLHHTHIVPVFDVGEHNGVHFYAMQFIQGQSLDLVIDALVQVRRRQSADRTNQPVNDFTQAVADGLLTGQFRAGADGDVAGVGEDKDENVEPPAAAEALAAATSSTTFSHSEFTSSHSGREFYRSVARVGLQVAEALAYAHSEGILHRDIKPSNLLLDARGNVWVTDFGLARDESTDGLTQTGDFVGTLRYMAPERLEGWSDRRSDLYSLGATLHELLTLRPFMETPNRGQLVDKILHESPPPPSKVDRLIPRDLETIVLKAIGKEPASRYRTASAMAEDLERFLSDRPISARRSTPTERIIRWSRRNPVVAALSGAVAALLVMAVVILGVSNARIRQESAAKDAALLEKDEALSTARRAVDQMLVRVGDEMLADMPLSNPIRQALLKDALQFYEGFVEQAAGEESLQFELARVLQKTAIVQRDLGRPEDAQRSIEKNIAILEKLVADAPRSYESRKMLAASHAVLGWLWHGCLAKHDLELAEVHYLKSLEICRALERDWPDRPQKTVHVLRHLAELAAIRGDLIEARKIVDEAIRAAQRLLQEEPTNNDVRAGLCLLYTHHYGLSTSEFEASLKAGLEHAAILLKQNPQYVSGRYAELELTGRLGDLYRGTDRIERAVALYHQAAEQSTSLCADSFAYWDRVRANYGDRLISVLLQAGREKEAQQSVNKYHLWCKAIARRVSTDPILQYELAQCEFQLHSLLQATGQKAKADDLRQKLVSRLSKLIEANPDAAWPHTTLGVLAAEDGNWNLSAAEFALAVELEARNVDLHYYLAIAQLQNDDGDGYRETCAQLVKNLAAANDEIVAWTCMLGPRGITRLNQLIGKAELLAQKNGDKAKFRVALGILQFRCEKYEKAEETLSRALATPDLVFSADISPLYASLFLAETKWKLGRTNEAQKMLADMKVALDSEMRSISSWNQRATLSLFRREAEALIVQDESSPNTRAPSAPRTITAGD